MTSSSIWMLKEEITTFLEKYSDILSDILHHLNLKQTPHSENSVKWWSFNFEENISKIAQNVENRPNLQFTCRWSLSVSCKYSTENKFSQYCCEKWTFHTSLMHFSHPYCEKYCTKLVQTSEKWLLVQFALKGHFSLFLH